MILVTLYTRPDCHLCEQTREDLSFLQSEIPHRLNVVNVDSTQELQQKFGFEVPVVEVGPYTLKAPISLDQLRVTLGAAVDREKHIQMVENSPAMKMVRQGRAWTKADSFTYWFARHWLSLFNGLVIIYLGLPFLAPVLMNYGFESSARIIYRVYSYTCHQLPYRSFFLFGDQAIYPRAQAGIEGVQTFSQATGLSEELLSNSDLVSARAFVGNPGMGYKVALCERDVAIYGGILTFGIIFGLLGKRIRGLPWYLWVIFGVLPIALDGGSQLISQVLMQGGLSTFSRESTPFLRVLTGFSFGFTAAWFGYPLVEQSMAESRQALEEKRRGWAGATGKLVESENKII